VSLVYRVTKSHWLHQAIPCSSAAAHKQACHRTTCDPTTPIRNTPAYSFLSSCSRLHTSHTTHMIPHLSRAFAQISTILDTLQPLQHDILHHITSHHITLALSNQPAHCILGTKTHRHTHTHTPPSPRPATRTHPLTQRLCSRLRCTNKNHARHRPSQYGLTNCYASAPAQAAQTDPGAEVPTVKNLNAR
jgi:hypothetical protein